MGGQREAPGLDSTLDPGRTMATPTPSKRLTGVLAPVLTPFRADLSPDPLEGYPVKDLLARREVIRASRTDNSASLLDLPGPHR